MTASFAMSFSAFRRPAVAGMAAAMLLLPVLSGTVQARGPEKIADTAEAVIDAVVNISTSQRVEAQARPGGPRQQERRGEDQGPGAQPQVPPGSPFEDFFKDFFENRRGPGGPGGGGQGENRAPRRTSSLGSGFVIDPSGLVVTNNHVIADAEEINVVFNDGSRLKAELVGKDPKTDIALLKINPEKPLKAVKFGDSDKLRLGEWVIAIGNPFSLGGSVSAGIVSARNRDIQSGPYDNYIQTDAAINRGNSGGPLFNLDGEVIGVNTAIISPSGGSIGIGFAVPSKVAMSVIDQLREYKEVRRGWLGVRIQQVTDDIA
ncbi:MAG: trypsin-like peptidase domain-containing protein, partial [Pseudorhodoplanes sp.]